MLIEASRPATTNRSWGINYEYQFCTDCNFVVEEGPACYPSPRHSDGRALTLVWEKRKENSVDFADSLQYRAKPGPVSQLRSLDSSIRVNIAFPIYCKHTSLESDD